jgi:hypothetical protein
VVKGQCISSSLIRWSKRSVKEQTMNLLITASRCLQVTYRYTKKKKQKICNHAKIYRAISFLYSFAPDILTNVNALYSFSQYGVTEKESGTLLFNIVAYLPHVRKLEPQNPPFLSNTRTNNGTAGLGYPFLGYGSVDTLLRRRLTSHSNSTGWESRDLSSA